jgi:hypothetical protein
MHSRATRNDISQPSGSNVGVEPSEKYLSTLLESVNRTANIHEEHKWHVS